MDAFFLGLGAAFFLLYVPSSSWSLAVVACIEALR